MEVVIDVQPGLTVRPGLDASVRAYDAAYGGAAPQGLRSVVAMARRAFAESVGGDQARWVPAEAPPPAPPAPEADPGAGRRPGADAPPDPPARPVRSARRWQAAMAAGLEAPAARLVIHPATAYRAVFVQR